jgi:hypothetical protein
LRHGRLQYAIADLDVAAIGSRFSKIEITRRLATGKPAQRARPREAGTNGTRATPALTRLPRSRTL